MKKIIILLFIGISLLFADEITLEKISVTADYLPLSDYRESKVDFSTIKSKIQLQQTSPGMYSPVMNGMQGELVGVEFEDVNLNNANFRSGPNQYFSWIPNEFVEYNIESGSAIGPTIDSHIVTDDVIHTEYSSYNDGRKLILKKNYGDTSVGVKVFKTGDYNGLEHTAYNQNAFYIQNKTDNNKFTAMYSTSDDIDRLDKFIQNKVYTYLAQDYLFLKDTYSSNKMDYFTLSYQRFVENILDGTKYIDSTNNVYGLKYKHKFCNGFDIHASDSLEDLMFDNKDYDYNTFKIGAGYKNTFNDIKIKSNYDYVIADTSSTTSKEQFTQHELNIEAAKGIVYTGFRIGYKLPTANNLYYARTTGKGTDIENPNLIPETSRTYTLGLKDEVGLFSYDVNVFYTQIRDAISSVKLGYTVDSLQAYQSQNVGDGMVKGANLTLFYEEGLLGSIFNASYVYGEEGSDYMSKVTPFKIFWKTEYNHAFVVWNYAMKGKYLSIADTSDVRIINSAFNQYNNKGYNTFDIGYGNIIDKNWNYSLTLNNIFNDDGREMGSSVDVPERSLTAKIGYNF